MVQQNNSRSMCARFLVHRASLGLQYTYINQENNSYNISLCVQFQFATLEKLDLLEELTTLKVVWRSVSIMSGELCVIRCGMTLMLVWSADK